MKHLSDVLRMSNYRSYSSHLVLIHINVNLKVSWIIAEIKIKFPTLRPKIFLFHPKLFNANRYFNP